MKDVQASHESFANRAHVSVSQALTTILDTSDILWSNASVVSVGCPISRHRVFEQLSLEKWCKYAFDLQEKFPMLHKRCRERSQDRFAPQCKCFCSQTSNTGAIDQRVLLFSAIDYFAPLVKTVALSARNTVILFPSDPLRNSRHQ